jgi:hypothetical protein
MNNFIKQKLLNVKEDLLSNSGQNGVKRTVRIMVEVLNNNQSAP